MLFILMICYESFVLCRRLLYYYYTVGPRGRPSPVADTDGNHHGNEDSDPILIQLTVGIGGLSCVCILVLISIKRKLWVNKTGTVSNNSTNNNAVTSPTSTVIKVKVEPATKQ